MTTEQQVRSIRELAPKPSDAIKAMLTGLRKIPSDRFVVRMYTFGETMWNEINGEQVYICCGCAATCAVHQLAKKTPDPMFMSARQRQMYLRLQYDDMRTFEDAIDEFRRGFAGPLLWYYDLSRVVVPKNLWNHQPWFLRDNDWQYQLPRIEEYVKELEAAGF